MKNIKNLLFIFLVLITCITGLVNKAKSDDSWKNFYTVCWIGTPTTHIRFAKQMGYDYIGIPAFATSPSSYTSVSGVDGLKFYLVDPYYQLSHVFEGNPNWINTQDAPNYTAAQKKFYNDYMCWKNLQTFPNNLATGFWDSPYRFHPMWDFQRQAVIDYVIANTLEAAHAFESVSPSFTFAGCIYDVPRLWGEFHTYNPITGGSPFTNIGTQRGDSIQSSLLHGTITHQYSTYEEGFAEYFKQLSVAMKAEFPNSKMIIEPSRIYNDQWAHNDGWVDEIAGRWDINVARSDIGSLSTSIDFLSQENAGTHFVDDFNENGTQTINGVNYISKAAALASMGITKSMVGSSQQLYWSDDASNRIIAGKCGINGSWYNWFGRWADMSVKSLNLITASQKLIRCLPNWDNLTNVPLASRSWNGSVYQSTRSYASSDVIYSRHWKTDKLFAVFLTTNGTINLNTGETVTSTFRVSSDYFVETTDGSSDVTIGASTIQIISSANLNKGYIFTLSGAGTSTAAPTVTTGTATPTGTSTATLEGVVTPNNLVTTYRWQWGTSSSSYSSATGSQTLNLGSGTTNVNGTLTGLTKNTTYYTRIQASNGSGSVSGSQTSFLTTGLTVYSAEQTGTNTITVDGILDEWGTLDIGINLTVLGLPVSNGTAAAKWVPGGLYVAVSVSDNNPTTNTGTTTPYNDDSVELYLDWDNNKQTTYDTYDRDFVTAYNSTYIYNIGTKTGVVVAGSHTATSWTKEIFIPTSNFPGSVTSTAGKRIGFGINLNDDNNGGIREGQKSWHTTLDTSWYDPSQFWELLMVGTTTEGGGSDPAMPSDAGSSTLSLFSPMLFYARLDGGTGTTSIVDATGNCPNGSLSGSVEWTTGTSGSGLKFTGTTTQFVDFGIATNARFGGVNQTYALSVDIKSGTTTSEGAAISRWNTNSNRRSWLLGQNTGTLNRARNKRSWDGSLANSSNNPVASTTLGLTTWHNIIFNYDDVNAVLHLDNVSDGTTASTQGVFNGTASVILGKDESDLYPFNGIMDNPRIFNRNLSVSERTDLNTWPTTTNGTASPIYGTWVTVTATATAFGTTTHAYVQYGTSSGNWGTKTSTLEYYIGTSSTPVTFTRTLGTLTSETQYYYRTVAYNTMGNMVYGVEQSFVTTSGTGVDVETPIGTVTVNSNGTFTTSVSVLLNLSATDDVGVTGYYASTGTTTPAAGDAGWVTVGTDTTYSNDIPYTLVESDGTQTVYVWYKDGVNNISAMAQDSIVLDTFAPLIVEITSPSGNCVYDLNGSSTRALGTTSSSITLEGNAYDDNGIGTVTISNSATTTTRTATGTDTWSSTEKIYPVLSDGLVARWALDETSGSIAYDSSPYFTANGTITGASVGTTSIFGGSRYFDGIDDYITLPNASQYSFGTTSNFSLSFLFNPGGTTTRSASRMIFTNRQNAPNKGYEFFYANSNTIHSTITGQSNTPSYGNPVANTWEMYTATIEVGSTTTMRFYNNGVQVGTQSGLANTDRTSSESLTISYPFSVLNGYVDEVRIYNRALSNEEVLQLYQLTTPDQVNTFTVTAQDVPGNEASDIIVIGAFPSIRTDWATSVTVSTVTLNGTCSANNNTATVWFDYGIESGVYTGSSTTATVTGATNTAVNITLANLNRSTTYYFRAAASSNVGTTYGTEFEFTTLASSNTVNTNGQFDKMDMSFPGSTNFNQYLQSIGIYPGLFWPRNYGTAEQEALKADPDTVLSDYLDQ